MSDNIMNVTPEAETDAWFKSLKKADQEKLQRIQQTRAGVTQRRELNKTPYIFWMTQNHVRKSDVHHAFKHLFITKQSRSRGRKPRTSEADAPNNETEVKDNGE